MRDHLHVSDGQAVLDAGSGSGWVSRLIARETPGATVTGIDITPGFVDYATSRANEEGLRNLDYRLGDVCELPFEDASFDLVWSQLVVFFLPHREKAIAEFARVLRPGGQVKVVVTEGVFEKLWPERKDISDGIRNLRAKVNHGWRLARLPLMLESAGLKDISVDAAVDRVFSFVGGASPEQRLNIVESLFQAMMTHHHLVGGEAQAVQLATELLGFIDEPAHAGEVVIFSAVEVRDFVMQGCRPGSHRTNDQVIVFKEFRSLAAKCAPADQRPCELD